MRLFISVNMKDTLRSRVVEIMNIMRAKTVRGNFTRPDNLHITLAFLGEIEPERIDDITRTMHQVGRDKRRKLSFELNDIGRFNDTWWIGVKRDQTLWDLQTALSNSLRKSGFHIDKRPFRPHLTICRKPVFSGDFDEAEFRADINPMLRGLVWEADRFDLMLSERINGRLTYSVLHSTELNSN
ncbi:MAG: RNA 2',3'-cyclic phosphodiesterase [Clostridiales bacterium]|jgi:2'-5' RNA ligase|nr:RNA 2',3'-cyclic phosphodiesterase [Clostridiales bacterium]